MENITFYNYPARNPDGPKRHALGAHFNHKNALIPKAFAMRGAKFINVDTYFQNAFINDRWVLHEQNQLKIV